MLSEARARLANTQGKKAKRKARERQLEESRRLAVLQKRRELKNAGINIKIVNKKKGQMDYNADIPFEKQAVSGFYDTKAEQAINEHQREAFDPRKQQLANKRKGDQEEDPERKRQKQDQKQPSAAMAAAARAGQMQRIREAEQQSKRKALVLPSPQVSDGELEEIVKMGMAGERASKLAGDDNDGTKGLISNYNNMVGSTPIRTPRAPPQEDHIANEIRNIRALTETQSSLLGGENTPLHEGSASTGFDGVVPRSHAMVTPNPMATPFRQGGPTGTAATRVGATPLRTPRDNFALNKDSERQVVLKTPRDSRIREDLTRQQLRAKLSTLPRPKETEWELEELPSESAEPSGQTEPSAADATERDRCADEARKAAATAEFQRQSQVYQRGLPRPQTVDYETMLERAAQVSDPVEAMIAREAAAMVVHDAQKCQDSKVKGKPAKLESLDDDLVAAARATLVAEVSQDTDALQKFVTASCAELETASTSNVPDHFTLSTTQKEHAAAFSAIKTDLLATAERGNKLEKKLAVHLGGYQARSKTLRAKIVQASDAHEKARIALDTFRTLQISEGAALGARLERLRQEVGFVSKREREAQEEFRRTRDELREVEEGL